MKTTVDTHYKGKPGASFTVKFGDTDSPRLSVSTALKLRDQLEEAIREHLVARARLT